MQAAAEGTPRPLQPDLRLIGAIHPLRTAFWVRKDSGMQTIADLKGKRVPLGYSAMRTVDMQDAGGGDQVRTRSAAAVTSRAGR